MVRQLEAVYRPLLMGENIRKSTLQLGYAGYGYRPAPAAFGSVRIFGSCPTTKAGIAVGSNVSRFLNQANARSPRSRCNSVGRMATRKVMKYRNSQ